MMSFQHLGPIIQMAYVVSDLDQGIEHWVGRMNVGPFTRFTDIRLSRAEYRGEDVTLNFEAAVAYSGELMVELIRPLGPSIFAEYLAAGNGGLHHLAYATDNFHAAHEELVRRGARRVQGGRFEDGTENAYYEIAGSDAFLEIGDLSPQLVDVFARLKDAAACWDGSTRTVIL